MISLDRELGGDNFKRAQDCGAHDDHDKVQSEAQGGEALWKVGTRAVTWEEEMTKGSETQNAICDSHELGREKAGGEVK